MTILKPGDPCPCCGQPIKTRDPDKLLLLSQLAEITGNRPAKINHSFKFAKKEENSQ